MTDIKINSDRYVYFNSDGEITKITNYKDLNETSLQVSFSEVENIISGAESSLNFLVSYDKLYKKYVLQRKIFSNISNLKSFMYEIPSDDLNSEILITRDLKNKKWKISISENLRNALVNDETNVVMFFSITKKRDPNILYRVIRVNLKDLVEKDRNFKFQYEREYDTDLSIYTVKQLNSYNYEVING